MNGCLEKVLGRNPENRGNAEIQALMAPVDEENQYGIVVTHCLQLNYGRKTASGYAITGLSNRKLPYRRPSTERSEQIRPPS